MDDLLPTNTEEVTILSNLIKDGRLSKLFVRIKDATYQVEYVLEGGSFDVVSSFPHLGWSKAEQSLLDSLFGIRGGLKDTRTVPWSHIPILLDTWRSEERRIKVLEDSRSKKYDA